jgi:transketolase
MYNVMIAETDQIARTRTLAAKIRRQVLAMTRCKGGHVGSCFSCVDILATLYDSVLKVDSRTPDWPERDRFILSKGHACAALYALLAEKGFFPATWLDSFYEDESWLPSHATRTVPGVEVSTGSLGHGLAIGAGMALAAKQDHAPSRVFVLLSDGECDEGSTWEAAMFAPFHRLDNLVAIVDYNKIQSLGRTREVLDLEPFADKWSAFGWAVREIDGHNFELLHHTFAEIPFQAGTPTCVVAHTVKGKGVSFMEDTVLWHYRQPCGAEYELAIEELSRTE